MSSESPVTKTGSGWRPVVLGTVLLVLAALGVAGAWLARRAPPDSGAPSVAVSPDPADPRRAYAGPYRNIAPEVRYVGDAKCAGCHEDIAKSYARHPMGQSMVPAAELIDRQRYSPDVNNPFTALGRRFEVERRGELVRHRQAVLDEAGQPVAELAQEVRWVIGSGRKGYSYLAEQDGYLFQTPISWFTQKQRWDLSPGFGPPILAGRLVSAACLTCHANRAREHPEHPDRFEPPVFEGHAIGCERCHGPGELHGRGDGDHTIVNPARLSPPLRDAVCEQCHLAGEVRVLRAGRGSFDFRPGLPLADFWAVLVQRRQSGEDAKAVNHVEQMHQSKCFRGSAGASQMGCITCHDPHVAVGPGEREAHYRAACLKCHDEAKGQRGCSEPLPRRRQTSPGDSCIDCHMTRYSSSDIAHTASTDHRIPRRPADDRPGPTTDLENARLMDFYQDHFPEGAPETGRALGLGMVKLMSAGQLRPERHGERVLLLLESALGSRPQDGEVRESMAQALLLMGRSSDALAEARLALEKRPGDWRLLAWAASAAQALGQNDVALGYWRRSVEINPFVREYQLRLMNLLVSSGEVAEARKRCRELLRLDPFSVPARWAWVGFLLQDGDRAGARREFDVIRGLKPPNLAALEERFRQQMK